MRILFATNHHYLPQRAGGLESNTHDLCLELQRAGEGTAVLAGLSPDGWLGLWNRVRRKLPSGRRFPRDRWMGYDVYRGWTPGAGVREVAGRFGADVVVVQGTGAVPLVQASLEAEFPTVLYLHDVEFDRLHGEIPSDRRLLVLANSRFTATRARSALGLEAAVVPPLIRPEAYRVSAEGTHVLYVNPHPWKGVEVAFALAERRPDVPFQFVESWKLRPERRTAYQSRAEALANVAWSTAVSDMRTMYARARIVLVPSQWEEAWGRVATEAQVSGIPVLASDRGGLPESVGPGGILVDPEGPLEGWLDALSRLWDDPEEWQRMSRSALEHSRRPGIQPDVLAARFREHLRSHLRTLAGQSA